MPGGRQRRTEQASKGNETMSARIVELSHVAAIRAARLNEATESDRSAHQFQFWFGASGRRYVHSVFSLIGCPELPRANYMLVRCDADGRRTVLRIGRTLHAAASLNLAEIRHRGAKLGANEVHVHFLPGTEQQRRAIETDLRAGHFSRLDGEHTPSRSH
jgi:hypothetical protein